MTNETNVENVENVDEARRRFLRGAAAAIAAPLVGCGGGNDTAIGEPVIGTPPLAPATVGSVGFFVENPARFKKGSLEDNKDTLSKYTNVVVNPDVYEKTHASSIIINNPIAYSSLLQVEAAPFESVAQATKDFAQIVQDNDWAIASEIPADRLITVDIRNDDAYNMMADRLKGMVDDYGGVYLDGLEAAAVLENKNPEYAGLTQRTVELMDEVAGYAKAKHKQVIIAGGFTQVKGVNTLDEAAKVATTLAVRGLFADGSEVTGREGISSAAKQVMLKQAIESSSNKNMSLLGVELTSGTFENLPLCDVQKQYSAFAYNIAGQNLGNMALFFDAVRGGGMNTGSQVTTERPYARTVEALNANAGLINTPARCI